MIVNEDDYLAHYGILRRSGRYPWGSGSTQNARNKSFLDYVDSMKKDGLSDVDICKGVGISTTQLRAAKSIAKNQQKQAQMSQAQKLKDKGLSNVAIGQKMGLNESSVRALLAPGAKDKTDVLETTSKMLKDEVDSKKYVDIGVGVEKHIGVSQERLGVAVAMLKEQGYEVHSVNIQQLGTGFDTQMKVLAAPGVKQKEVWENRYNIQQISRVSDDGGRSFGRTNHPPIPISPKRVEVRFAEDGGDKADGMIYVREGVKDLSLGTNRYAQVRVQIGPDRYLKGMAMYKEGLPEGVDLQFHTNKPRSEGKLGVMKKLEDDPDLPFGSVVRQITEHTGTDKEKVTSAMNLVNEQGDWQKWSRNISAQALSKQSPKLAKTQLDMTFESRKQEYDNLMALTNPTVKKKLLEKFAEGTDSASVHLKAAALERQNWRVILPIDSLKPSEIYAPTFRDGERVVLIRYPHGGTFEIPELVVNNRHAPAKKLMGDARDAVGIHHSVAQRLSGADFDGDTVLVIPNNHNKVSKSPALESLKNFDPVRLYRNPEGVKFTGNKQQLMGDVSNLITDMTIKGASHEQISRAVRHSMVVIDSEKHNLNHRQSAEDFGIKQLKQEYQGKGNAGAATLISRAGSKVSVPDRKERPQTQGGPVDRETGQRVFVETGKLNGFGKPKMIQLKKLAATDDAHTLVSDANTPMEKLYADHSNKLKSLANQARLSALKTPSLQRSPSAAVTYASHVASLNAKLALAEKNAPLERQAQVIANAQVAAKKAANPNLDGDTLKKIKYQAQEDARARMGAGKQKIKITPEEWNAIQAGAISNSKLTRILNNADVDVVRELATPKTVKIMTTAKTVRAQAMLDSGFTRAEVADHLGVSISTLDAATSGVEEGDD